MNENQKKIPVWMIALVIVLFVALTVVIVMVVMNGTEETAEPSESISETAADPAASDNAESDSESESEAESTEPKAPELAGYGNNTAAALENYASMDITADSPDMAEIVAINEAGEDCLTNGELQIYYWIEFYNFMNSYGSYASMMGLDANTPLSEQASMQEGYTWEQYFLESASVRFGENYALAQAAYDNGYTISEEDAQRIDDMTDPEGDFAAEAAEYGYSSAEEYLQANFGKGIDIEDYQNYLRTYFAASNYYSQRSEELEASISEADVIAHYDENAETFAEQGLAKVNNVAVRHILISVEGEQDENGEYSAEAWAAAEEKANELYAEWQKNPTEENFIEMATEHTTDPGSQENGGLYDDVYPGQMVTEFNDWCFDASRVAGDHGIVKTTYGYHIMYFVKQNETRKWYDAALEDMMGVELNAMLDEMIEKYPLKFDFKKVRLYDMISASVAEAEAQAATTTEEPSDGETSSEPVAG